MPIITMLENTPPRAMTTLERLKPRQAMDTMSSSSAAGKYAASGRRSSVSTCTPLMVRNSSAGISSRKTRLERSLTADSRIQSRRPAK